MGTSISYKRPDGKENGGYLALAERGNAPGVVVIQEWWGLQEQIKGICDRFALAGFDALAPDLYKGVVVPYHDTRCRRQRDELAELRRRGRPERARRGAVPEAQRRKGRHHRLLPWRRGLDHRRGEDLRSSPARCRSTAFRPRTCASPAT